MSTYDLGITWKPDRPVNESVDKLATTEMRIEGELTAAVARIIDTIPEDRQSVVQKYCGLYVGRCLTALHTMREGLKCLHEYEGPDPDEKKDEWQTS